MNWAEQIKAVLLDPDNGTSHLESFTS